MAKHGLSSNAKSRIGFLLIAAFIMLVTVAYTTALSKWDTEETKSISVEDTMESTNEVEVTPRAIEEEPTTAMAYMTFNDDMSADASKTDAEIFQAIANDIEEIKKANPEIIAKYFGVSDVFTPDTVADRVSATTITLLTNEDESLENGVVLHICTIDYPAMNNDYLEAEEIKKTEDTDDSEIAAKKEVTKNLISGNYDVCFNIPVNIVDGELVISEALKQAITGGWYSGTGVTLNPVECVLN